MTKPQNPRVRKQRIDAQRSVFLSHRISKNDLMRLNELSRLAGVKRSQIVQWGIQNAIKNFKRYYKPTLFENIQTFRMLNSAKYSNGSSNIETFLDGIQKSSKPTKGKLIFTKPVK